jgi:hypothetical protein
MNSSLLKHIAITLILAVAPVTITTAQAAVKVGSYVGNWKASTTYVAGDLITYSNKTFLSLVKNKAKDPIKNPKVWQVLGGVGADGVGVIGPQGPAGLQGPIGLTGLKGDAGPVGTATGDMQWWNGSAWVMIGVGANNTTLKNCDGIPTWVVGSCPFIIGDTGPAGGKVFYLTDATGLHGLEAAPGDQSVAAAWGCWGTSITGADGTAVGTGAANTADIVVGCAEANTAATIADAYALNGYTDWYLPSKDELNLLYQQKNIVGGFADTSYSSSSEYHSNLAWLQGFSNGFQYSLSKNYPLPVRAVRSF